MFGLASFKNQDLTLYLACVWARTLKERRIYIVIRACLPRVSIPLGVVGLALFKNEEYILHLALLGWHTLCSLQMAYRSTVYFSTGTIGTNGTNRQVVSARLSSVNICSLKMENRSAAFFFIGTKFIPVHNSIGSNRFHWKSSKSIGILFVTCIY